VRLFRRHHEAVCARYPALGDRRLVHEVVRRMINDVVTDLIEESARRLAAAGPAGIDDVRAHDGALVAFSEEKAAEHRELKQFLSEHVYRHYRVLRMTTKARRVLRELFEALFADVRLMPDEHRVNAQRLEAEQGPAGRARAVADYIAGMTDRYAFVEHRRLYSPSELT
jgi:dGTPase